MKADELLPLLRARFDSNRARHPDTDWARVEKRLKASPKALATVAKMEETGGEPDVVAFDSEGETIAFVDCSPQSPVQRASLCYDEKALKERKKFKPAGSAQGLAAKMGVELLTEEEYMRLQALGEFDTKSSSWLNTPADIRKLGGAIFGDRRFGRVFIYHNGVESYYSGRGFRTVLRV